MAVLTATTIENLTVVNASAGAGGPLVIFTPSAAEIGRYRFRVIRVVATGTVAVTDFVKIEGITPKPDGTGTETQTLFLSTPPSTTAYIDQVSFPDECEFRGKIQITIQSAAGVYNVFLYHG